MTEGNFVDYVKIHVTSGKGGQGSAHLRREKFIPKGGPDGGDGGRGGHIILKANSNLWTLHHLKFKRHYKAGYGGAGSKQTSTGADGEDIYVEVPLGTVVINTETGERLKELLEHDDELILAKGGMGGLGNNHFKSSTNQAPHYAQPGEEGIEEWIILELKLLADVGLVGFPNAGKSTLLSSISAARPEIGDYPFTTLVPNLGVVSYRDDKSFVMADIPGIIEGAAEGKGLGIRFLRHIERNSILLFLIPADAKDIGDQYRILLGELRKYNPELLDKKRLLAISKVDMLDEELMQEMERDIPKDLPYVFISSVSQYNLEKLKDLIWQAIHS